MTTPIPSLTARRPHGRTPLVIAAATAAALVLSACGASGGSDDAAPKDPTTSAPAPETTTTPDAPVTTAATTTADEEPADRTAAEPAPAGTVFTLGDTLYETDLTSPEPGGWPAAGENHAYGDDGLSVTVGSGKAVYTTPVDEKFPGNVMVEARWDLEASPPLVGRGVACRTSTAGAYVGAVTESPITAGAWTWGIYKKVGDESFEQLTGSGIDGEGPIPLSANAPTLSLSLGCSRTVQGEQLMFYVGDTLAGITVDVDPLGGSYTSLFTQGDNIGGSVLVTDFRVSETVAS